MRAKHRRNRGGREPASVAAPQAARPDPVAPSRVRNGIWPRLFACLVFALVYIQLAWAVEPRLIYYAQPVSLRSGQSLELPLFAKGTAFFQEQCGRPGGLVQYVAA